MGRREISHNARQIVSYLEWVWHLVERTTQTPDKPMNRKAKGSSQLPMSVKALELMVANAAVTERLEPVLQEAKRSEAAMYGIYFSDLLLEVTERPAAVSQFRALEQSGYPGEEGKRARAFFRMCLLFAYALRTHDGPGGPCVLHVHTNTREDSTDPRTGPPGKARTYTAHDSYRRMVEEMEAMVLAGTHSKEGAKAAKADQLMCSMGRVKDAVTWVNKERDTVFSPKRQDDGEAA